MRVLQIFTCTEKGAPMVSRTSVNVEAGIGIIDDRYGLGTGAWSKTKPPKIRHMSLIESEVIQERTYPAEHTRRNIVTEGVQLNELVGVQFSIGGVLVRGYELCTPCNRPSQLVGRKGFHVEFDNYGGLRVEVLSDGIISIDSNICL